MTPKDTRLFMYYKTFRQKFVKMSDCRALTSVCSITKKKATTKGLEPLIFRSEVGRLIH